MPQIEKTTKEKILEEFDKISPEFGKWRMDRNMARAFLSKAIDQTIEETIREVNSILPEEMIDNGGDVSFRGFNDCLDQIKQSLKSLINK